MVNDDKHSHLTALHARYERLNLRGLWQRDSRTAPELKPRIWRWSEMQPILEETLRTVRLPEDTDQRVIGLDVPGLSTGAVFISYTVSYCHLQVSISLAPLIAGGTRYGAIVKLASAHL